MRDLETLATSLRTRRIGRTIDLLETTASTMDDARAAIERGAADGHVVVADTQSAGRGSHGRAWQSPPGDDLYLSIVFRPTVPLERLSTMTLAVGLAVARTVDAIVGRATASVKWPNDVLVDDAKCAGILVESRATSAGIDGVVVGIGLNCNRPAATLPDGARVISLGSIVGRRVDRSEVAVRLFEELEAILEVWSEHGLGAILPELVAKLAYRDEAVRLDAIDGILLGIADDGSVVLRTQNGVESFSAGRLIPK